MGAGEHLTERADRARQLILEKQPLDPAGIALEQSAHCGKPADPQQLPLVWRAIASY
jgi:hypothetical protein